MTENEKGASTRFKAKSGSHIVYLEGSGAIKDLSLNGMFVFDPDPLSEGSKVNFVLRQGTDDIQLQGIVTRSDPGQGMVIQFAELTRESIRRLKIYLATINLAPDQSKKQ